MPHSLMLILPATALCATVFAAMLYCRHRTRLEQLDSQLLHITINQELKELLGNIQQHRGMVSGYLNGDVSFKYKISALQAEINRQTAQIARHLQSSAFNHAGFEAIQNLWQQLYPSVLAGSRGQSFDSHCLLIGTVLNLIRDIAEHSQLHRDSGCPFSFVEIVWHLLPDTAEAIGQTRAIGTGIAAAGRSLSTERIKLGFLVMRIRKTLTRLELGLSRTFSVMDGNELQHTHGEVQGHINRLVTDIEQQLLATERPTVSPTSFFEHATLTLNSVFALYDHGVTIARRDVQVQLANTRRSSNRSLATALSSLVLATVAITHLSL